ncbi:Serine--tRNA ligase, mitochondrial [Coemansia sp. RSA 1358]|nr:Serine--tRNA ligase, mitochondrial [Coemansia sp. RSA 1358]
MLFPGQPHWPPLFSRAALLRVPTMERSRQMRTIIQPSFDYKYIRDNADILLDNAVKRNVKDARPHKVGQLYDEFRALTSAANDYRGSLNTVSKELGTTIRELKSSDGEDRISRKKILEGLRSRARKLKADIQEIEEKLKKIQASLMYEAAKIPNMSHPDTPVGDESKARVFRTNGSLDTVDRIPKDGVDTSVLSAKPFADHYKLALKLGIIDMEAGAKVAGSRFHYWKGAGALLELALVQYAMTRAAGAGFVPHITPDVARSSIVDACGFRPRSNAEDDKIRSKHGEANISPAAHSFASGEASQIYRVTPVAEELQSEHDSDADPLCLVATAEIPLVAMKQKQILSAGNLPLSFAGLSHCFRAEAGARGRDTRGIYRLHQFTKVELVTLSHPEHSDNELARLVDFQSSLYADLGLTFRVLQMPTHELGASAYQKFDIEAWMPGRKAWGEISSASNCTDYQARRLSIRARLPKKDDGVGSASPVFVHTLNATAVAVPRIVVALLESFQRPDGSVVVPKVLRPWMMGIDALIPDTASF